jgi:hypothetical protein
MIAGRPFVASFAALHNRRPVPFTRIITNRLQSFAAPPDPVADTPYIVSFGALEARNPHRPFFFPAIIRGLIRYQIPAPQPPVASKPLILSFGAMQASEAARHQRYPKGLVVIFKGPEKYSPAVTGPPIARAPYLVSQIARDIAKFRGHVLHKPAIVLPNVPVPLTRIRPKFKIQHEEAAKTQRHRQHEQQVKRLVNELLRNGQIIGTLDDPMLGYVATDPQAVGTTEPLTIAEVLDRIIAYIKSQNGTGI